MAGERTEKASPQKRKKATEKGDRLISREMVAASAMLAGAMALRVTAAHWSLDWRESYRASLDLAMTSARGSLAPGEVAVNGRSIAAHCLSTIPVFGLCSMTAALLVGVAQGGGQLSLATIAPKASRLNPATHVKSMLGLQSLVRLGKSLLPAGVIAWMAITQLMGLSLAPGPGFDAILGLFRNIYDLLLGTAIAMAVWSAIDYANSWQQRERRLRMTKQDVKDELKDVEGSPQVKRRIRQIQRQTRKRQLRADVRQATVVVTNPTHYAVALSFDFEKMEPPKVLVKGQNLIARQIREEAQWAGVPIVENPPLARSLYRSVEPGQSIPFELYAAVAGILAFLYRRERQGTGTGAQKTAAQKTAAQKTAGSTAAASAASMTRPRTTGNAAAGTAASNTAATGTRSKEASAKASGSSLILPALRPPGLSD